MSGRPFITHQMMEYRNTDTLSEEENMSCGFTTDVLQVQECPDLGLKILQGINKLRQDGVSCDVTLIAEGTKFKCHKVVLASCSDYFQAMFTNGMRESNEKEIELKGVTAKGLQKVLEVMYTTTTTLEGDDILDVIVAANHLLATPVIEFCEVNFLLGLTTTNLDQYIYIAKLYDMENLLQQLDVFIAKNLMKIANDGVLSVLTYEQMTSCLTSDNLCLRELDVFHITWEWLRMDVKRLINAPDLMKLIRFPLISQTDLVEHVQGVDHMMSNPELSQMVQDALTYHAIPYSQPLMHTDSTRLRSCGERLVSVGGLEHHPYPSMHNEMLILESRISPYNLLKCHQMLTLPWTLSHMQVVVYNNFLYVLGGCTSRCADGESAVNLLLRYDPRLNKWFKVCSMLDERAYFFACALNDQIYAIGGSSKDRILASVERYDLALNTWEFVSSIPMPKCAHAGAVYGNYIFISGGVSTDGISTPQLHRYDPKADAWEDMAPMRRSRAWHVMCASRDKLFVFGGGNNAENEQIQPVLGCEFYEPATDQWTMVARIIIPHLDASCVAYDDNIYVLGGNNMQVTPGQNTVSRYNVLFSTWQIVGALPQSMTGVGYCKLKFPLYPEEEL